MRHARRVIFLFWQLGETHLQREMHEATSLVVGLAKLGSFQTCNLMVFRSVVYICQVQNSGSQNNQSHGDKKLSPEETINLLQKGVAR